MTVAEFMDLALYDPDLGYYARAARRSGRAGDFFTSVDVGPLFGELLAGQIEQMATLLAASSPAVRAFDLVEAGAGNGRLAADILSTLSRDHPSLYARTRLHLVEASPAARAAQPAALGPLVERVASTSASVPDAFDGVLVANELFDAMPVHQVVMRPGGLREVRVACVDGRLTTIEGPLSTEALAEYFDALDIVLEPGWRVEVNLAATQWIRDAARRMQRGFMILIDYGHEARDLYSASHSGGTLTTFSRHLATGAESAAPAWTLHPGEQDITAHVDFTSLRKAAERAGMVTLGLLDQTYFLLSIFEKRRAGAVASPQSLLALRTLVMPGGLGSTMKVLVLAKDAGHPALLGCSGATRLT